MKPGESSQVIVDARHYKIMENVLPLLISGSNQQSANILVDWLDSGNILSGSILDDTIWQ